LGALDRRIRERTELARGYGDFRTVSAFRLVNGALTLRASRICKSFP